MAPTDTTPDPQSVEPTVLSTIPQPPEPIGYAVVWTAHGERHIRDLATIPAGDIRLTSGTVVALVPIEVDR